MDSARFRVLLSLIMLYVSTSDSVAQTGTSLGGTGINTGTTGGTGSLSGGSGGTGGGTGTQPTLAEVQAPPTILAPSQVQTTPQALSPSNFLATTYANPYYQGRAGAQLTDPPGGFGTPLYTTSGGPTGIGGQGPAGFSTGGTLATAGNTGFTRTGAGGISAGGLGGTAGLTGIGGMRQGGTLGGIGGTQLGRTGVGGGNASVLVPLPRPISYQAVLKFRAAPAVAPAVMQANLQGLVARTPFITNPAGVQVLTDDGGHVVLRGTVADADEARLIEGVIRLTPGVTAIRNELAVRPE